MWEARLVSAPRYAHYQERTDSEIPLVLAQPDAWFQDVRAGYRQRHRVQLVCAVEYEIAQQDF